jgi:hypothetical protein
MFFCINGLQLGEKVGIKRFGNAQATVELILVLPIFMLIIVFIMEIGLLAYQTILAHHAAYEILRIGSLVAGPPGGRKNPDSAVKVNIAEDKMNSVLDKFFPRGGAEIKKPLGTERTGEDPQTDYGGKKHQHFDLVLTLQYKAKLVFPVSSYFLSDPPKGSGERKIYIKMRMPIEVPVFN